MQLHPNLSFCRINDQFVFLDLARDRYFSLAGELPRAFEALLAGSADQSAAALLTKAGLIMAGHDERIAPCSPDMPKATMLDRAVMSAVSPLPVLALALAFTAMRARLRCRGLAMPAADLAAARRAAVPNQDKAQLIADASAHERLCLLSGAHNLCLPLSLALATRLARRGYAAEVVLGVQLRPFAAHSWVECQGQLVNDRLDRLRSYTPIRRL